MAAFPSRFLFRCVFFSLVLLDLQPNRHVSILRLSYLKSVAAWRRKARRKQSNKTIWLLMVFLFACAWYYHICRKVPFESISNRFDQIAFTSVCTSFELHWISISVKLTQFHKNTMQKASYLPPLCNSTHFVCVNTSSTASSSFAALPKHYYCALSLSLIADTEIQVQSMRAL